MYVFTIWNLNWKICGLLVKAVTAFLTSIWTLNFLLMQTGVKLLDWQLQKLVKRYCLETLYCRITYKQTRNNNTNQNLSVALDATVRKLPYTLDGGLPENKISECLSELFTRSCKFKNFRSKIIMQLKDLYNIQCYTCQLT